MRGSPTLRRRKSCWVKARSTSLTSLKARCRAGMAAHPQRAAPLSEMAAPSIQHATRTSDPKEALLAALQPFIESVGEALVGETVERLLRQTCALSLQLAAREQLRAEQTHLLPRILDELVAEEVRAMAPAIAPAHQAHTVRGP